MISAPVMRGIRSASSDSLRQQQHKEQIPCQTSYREKVCTDSETFVLVDVRTSHSRGERGAAGLAQNTTETAPVEPSEFTRKIPEPHLEPGLYSRSRNRRNTPGLSWLRRGMDTRTAPRPFPAASLFLAWQYSERSGLIPPRRSAQKSPHFVSDGLELSGEVGLTVHKG